MIAQSESKQKNRSVEPTFNHWPSAKGAALKAVSILDKSSDDEDIETMLAATAAKATVV